MHGRLPIAIGRRILGRALVGLLPFLANAGEWKVPQQAPAAQGSAPRALPGSPTPGAPVPLLPGRPVQPLPKPELLAPDRRLPLACGIEFARPCADATSLTSSRLRWAASRHAEVTHYRVMRGLPEANAQQLALLPAGTNEFVDDTLVPDSLTNYYIEAVRGSTWTLADGPRFARGSDGVARERAPSATGLQVTQVQSVEVSGVVSVATGKVPALSDVRLNVAAVRPGRVQLSWRAVPGVSGFEVLRNGSVVRRLPGGTTAFEEASLPDDNYSYRLRAFVTARDGRQFNGPDSGELAVRLTPFRVLAFGDSVMWGQGIEERSKFTTLVVNALRARLPVDVEFRSLAHSGATLLPPADEPVPLGFDETRLATHGEVPNTYPTIGFQFRVQGPQVLRELGARTSDVDLILIDGCANDIGILKIVDPGRTAEEIGRMARERCGAWMQAALHEVARLYPSARIVVTGYYQALSEHSDRTAFNLLFGGLSAGGGALLAGWAAGPIIGGIISVVVTETAAQRAIENAARFKVESDAALRSAVDALNRMQPGRAVFAESGFRPENAYASKTGASFLWLVPLGVYPNDLDQLHSARQVLCRAPGAIETSLGAPLRRPPASDVEGARQKCFIAALAHPNALGAASYARSVLAAIEPFVPAWQRIYARQRSID